MAQGQEPEVDMTHDLNDVIQSMSGRLSDAQVLNSRLEAVIIFKDNKIKELESELSELKQKLTNEGEDE